VLTECYRYPLAANLIISKVSRALGDFTLQPFITAEPDVFEIDFEQTEAFTLIIACDGLWDVVSDEAACNLIKDIQDPEESASALRKLAFQKGSQDNISIIVLKYSGNS
jgi:serine/threonine protein phosphatase PrpC